MDSPEMTISPSSLSYYRRREEHIECIIVPRANKNEYLIKFVNASIGNISGHKIHDSEKAIIKYDSLLARKAAIAGIENYVKSGEAFLCMGRLSVRFGDKFDPKYVFISDADADYVSQFFVHIKEPES